MSEQKRITIRAPAFPVVQENVVKVPGTLTVRGGRHIVRDCKFEPTAA